MTHDLPGADMRHDVSIGSAVARVAKQLRAAGLVEPSREARQLVCAALDIPTATLLAAPETPLSVAARGRVEDWSRRRAAREPLWRIVGEREFYGRSFALSAATLEPRPDSETLIDAVLQHVRLRNLGTAPLRILDVGTGTGCLLVTLLAELPTATGVGIDISTEALETAACNADRHGVSPRIAWRETSALDGITSRFDILVSNPPYIVSAEIETLAPEVRCHDPRIALDGGPDGLAIYRALATGISRVVPKGFLVVEHGSSQQQDVMCILADACRGRGACEIEPHTDIAGQPRAVSVWVQ